MNLLSTHFTILNLLALRKKVKVADVMVILSIIGMRYSELGQLV